MQVQSVNNSVNRVKFTSNNHIDKALAFVNMNDAEIRQLSLLKTQEERGKKRNHLKSLLITLPLVDTASKFILQNGGVVDNGKINFNNKMYSNFKILPGSLSQKASAAGHTAMKWGGVLIVLGIYNSFKNAIVSKSEKLQNIERNHPLASMFADLGLFIASLSLAEKGAGKIAEKMVKRTPEFLEQISKKVSTTKVWLDKTPVNTKVLPKVSELFGRVSKKVPLLAAVGLATVATAPFIVIINNLFKASKQNRDYNNCFRNNYINFKEEQINVAKHVSNMLNVKNDILSQDSPIKEEV